MVQLRIEQQFGKTHLDIKPPELKISIRSPQLQLQSTEPELQIRQQEGRLQIDQYPSRASLGYRNTKDRMKDYAQAGQRAVLEGTARRAREGNQMMKIEQGGNAIAAIAKQSTYKPPKGLKIAAITPPSIQYQSGKLDMNVVRGKVDGTLHWGTVEGQHNWGTVRGYMAQHPSIRFYTTGSVVDRQL
ncbi:DUF6470 family protein [Heliorestis convoluta]|uniref:Uncharacterized protein n=1 Tax=Heliorestis convoluta TaxID=356322 RepID=A0A5Q2MXL3_9FIRM|nr:DUF6470 family protein [Heliorestis convoluta]QGG47484.1 hypothetical protein FTV88_1337 [Heliorestis convoluta]